MISLVKPYEGKPFDAFASANGAEGWRREGFEPSVEFPLHTLSKRAPSTTRTSLRVFRISSLQASG